MTGNKIFITLEVDDKGSAKLKKFGGNADKAFAKMKANAKAGASSAGGMEKAWTSSLNNIRNHWKGYSAAAAVVLAAVAVGVNKAIKDASNLQEVTNKFNVVYKDQIPRAESWAQTLKESYAMSTREAKQHLSAMQDLLVPMGMQSKLAGQLSNEIVKLSADLGSFNNLPTSKVMEDVQSALVGNYETMKKYGVVLKESTVSEKALAIGLADTKDQLTASDKAMAAYQIILEGSTAAVGDMARSEGSHAKAQKEFDAATEDLSAKLGTVFLPVATDVIGILKEMVNWVSKAIDYFGKFDDKVKVTAESIDDSMDIINQLGIDTGTNITKSAEQWTQAQRLMFDELEVLAKNSQAAATKATTEESGKQAKIAKNTYDSILAAYKKAAAGRVKTSKETGKAWEKQYAKEFKELEDLLATKVKEEKDYARESTRIYEQISNDVAEKRGDMYEYERKILDRQYEEYKKYAKDLNLLDEWYNGKLEDLRDEHARKYGSFLERLEVRWKDYQREAINANSIMYDTIASGMQNLEGQISDNFFAVLTGKMDDLKWDWDNLWNSMARTVSDKVAEMAIEAGTAATLDWVTSLFAAQGVWKVEKDNQPAIVHKGEMIVPADLAEKIRSNAMTTGYSENFDAMRTSYQGLDDYGVREAIARGTLNKYGKIGAVGISMVVNDQIGWGKFFDAMTSAPMLATSVMTGGVPAGYKAATGIQGKTADIGGLLGVMGLSALGMSGLGVTALGLIAGMTIGDLIGDALNLRENEMYRDQFEDMLGYRGGRQGYSAYTGIGGQFEYGGVPGKSGPQGGWVESQSGYGGSYSSGYGYSGGSGPTGLSGRSGGYSGGGSHVGEGGTSGFGWEEGGISRGPKSGHWEFLHGDEAIIPLKGGKVPVEMKNSGDNTYVTYKIQNLLNIEGDNNVFDDKFVEKLAMRLRKELRELESRRM